MPSARKTAADPTHLGRYLVASFCFLSSGVLALRAFSAWSSLQPWSSRRLDSLLLIAGFPAALSVVFAGFGVAVARGWLQRKHDSGTESHDSDRPGWARRLLGIAAFVTPLLSSLDWPTLHDPMWIEATRHALLLLSVSALLGAVIAMLLLARGARSRAGRPANRDTPDGR